MSGYEGDQTRRLIPRWRYSRDYDGSAEFQGDPRRKNNFKPELAFLDERLTCWKSSRSIATAADAVACGLTYDLHEAVREPAEYLLEQGDRAMPSVVHMAETIVRIGGISDGIQPSFPLASTVEPKSQAMAVIREKRAQLRRYPRNSLAHIDMARGYAILGQTRQATDSLRCALCLSPDHRIVLRLASRFLVHADDAARARLAATSSADKDRSLVVGNRNCDRCSSGARIFAHEARSDNAQEGFVTSGTLDRAAERYRYATACRWPQQGRAADIC